MSDVSVPEISSTVRLASGSGSPMEVRLSRGIIALGTVFISAPDRCLRLAGAHRKNPEAGILGGP